MTTIESIRKTVEGVRSLPNKREKLARLNLESREVLNFIAGNIRKDGIGKVIAEEVSSAILSRSSMEDVIDVFGCASELSGRVDKMNEMKRIVLSSADRHFVLECLYGSLKIGVSIPVPDPLFGDVFKPQLCGTGIDFNARACIIEEKFDGIRCIGVHGDKGVKLYTRNGKPIVSEVISRELADAIPSGFVLDGELVSSSGNFQDMRRHSDDIVYRVFDMPFHTYSDVTGLPLHARRNILEESVHYTDHILLSSVLHLSTMRDIDKWIEKNGVEGVVAKDPNSPYSFGGRKTWVKVKPFLDISGWVRGWTPGEGKREGILGAVEFLPDGFENTTLVGSGFTDEGLLEMKDLLKAGKRVRITVKYQNLTKDNRLRFPTFLRIDGSQV